MATHFNPLSLQEMQKIIEQLIEIEAEFNRIKEDKVEDTERLRAIYRRASLLSSEIINKTVPILELIIDEEITPAQESADVPIERISQQSGVIQSVKRVGIRFFEQITRIGRATK
ncbi:MAG: hypothetical protein WD595_04810 [Waddliaceae bacterium]